MSQPKVSIIVPCYKVELYLDRCVESLVNQTLREIEIILVDDGSPDRVPQMCETWKAKDHRIRVVHKQNAGLGMACNSGIEVATGEYIAFCDSDDWVELDCYEKLYAAAQKHIADAVFSGIQTVNEKGEKHLMNQPDKLEVLTTRERIHAYAMDMIASDPSEPQERKIAMSAKIVLYRKALIDCYQLRFVSERELISEDLVWNIDVLAHANCVVALPETFYNYFNNGASLTHAVRIDRFSFFKVQRDDLKQRLANYGFDALAQFRNDRMFIGYSRFYLGQLCNSTLPEAQKKQLVREICTDAVWQEVWKSYPVKQMPPVHRLFAYLMKHHCYRAMKWLFRLRK